MVHVYQVSDLSVGTFRCACALFANATTTYHLQVPTVVLRVSVHVPALGAGAQHLKMFNDCVCLVEMHRLHIVSLFIPSDTTYLRFGVLSMPIPQLVELVD